MKIKESVLFLNRKNSHDKHKHAIKAETEAVREKGIKEENNIPEARDKAKKKRGKDIS